MVGHKGVKNPKLGVKIHMAMRQTIPVCEGVNFSYIHEDKFKTSRISFTMFLPLDSSTAAANAVLSEIITRTCKKYPDFVSFNRQLENLYGADIYSGIDKLGEVQVLSISGISIDDNFAFEDTQISIEVAKLLREVIFNPSVSEESFGKDDLEQSKRQIIENIRAEYSDKKSYARHRCEQLMCEGETFGISKYGTESKVSEVTGKGLFDTLKNNLRRARIEIMVCGNIEYKPIYDIFCEAFKGIKREKIYDCSTKVITEVGQIREFKDLIDVTQCKLTLGFRTPYASSEREVYPMKAMCALFGGTPSSKLFLNVREKLSLCYYCSCRHSSDKGIVLVESGVEKSNISKAKEEILSQLQNIQQGKFTDEEVTATKIYLIQMYGKIQDSLSSLDNWYINQSMHSKIDTPEEAIECIEKVTREEIIEAAKSTKLDTVYMLMGSEE